jgi:hypothetical protein
MTDGRRAAVPQADFAARSGGAMRRLQTGPGTKIWARWLILRAQSGS